MYGDGHGIRQALRYLVKMQLDAGYPSGARPDIRPGRLLNFITGQIPDKRKGRLFRQSLIMNKMYFL